MILTILLVIITILIFYKHYEPHIDIVILTNQYKVYLWYNKYITPKDKVRTYKHLFTL